ILAIKLLLLWLDPTPKLFYGGLMELHLDGADRLDPRGPIVLLRLPDTLACALAAQFCSAFSRSGARQRRNSNCFCDDLQPLLQNVEKYFVCVRIVVRAGSLAGCLGALRDD